MYTGSICGIALLPPILYKNLIFSPFLLSLPPPLRVSSVLTAPLHISSGGDAGEKASTLDVVVVLAVELAFVFLPIWSMV
jgi:hypothetical protein